MQLGPEPCASMCLLRRRRHGCWEAAAHTHEPKRGAREAKLRNVAPGVRALLSSWERLLLRESRPRPSPHLEFMFRQKPAGENEGLKLVCFGFALIILCPPFSHLCPTRADRPGTCENQRDETKRMRRGGQPNTSKTNRNSKAPARFPNPEGLARPESWAPSEVDGDAIDRRGPA